MQVRLTAYDPSWSKLFWDEVGTLSPLFEPHLLRLEHFGSTAVPGAAKPVVDMLAVVDNISCADDVTDRLAALGYEAAGEWGIPGRRLFRKGGESRTHHLHVYQSDSPHIARHLVVRDYLRQHPGEREQYSQCKRQLDQVYVDTREYSQAKHAYVDALERRAVEWAAARNPRACHHPVSSPAVILRQARRLLW